MINGDAMRRVTTDSILYKRKNRSLNEVEVPVFKSVYLDFIL